MFKEEMKLDFHDLRIKPCVSSKINSRSDTNPFYEIESENFLPIFTAPMDTVIDKKNAVYYIKNKIFSILPRGEGKDFNGSNFMFKSVGLDEFIEKYITKKIVQEGIMYILIDIANGHMTKLSNCVKKAKKIYGDSIILMVGNVANPETFRVLSKAGADYIRIGVGNGSACLTSKQASIGYPMASLIKECYNIKTKHKLAAKIVADGGMKGFSDIILALALGADYVMVGSLLNKSLESCADTYLLNKIRINQYSNFAKWCLKHKIKLTKKFRGMSTKEVQRKWGKKIIKTSEGISKTQKVEYTIHQWSENLEDYLRSTMSYTNSKTLKNFIGKVEIIRISDKSYERFNK